MKHPADSTKKSALQLRGEIMAQRRESVAVAVAKGQPRQAPKGGVSALAVIASLKDGGAVAPQFDDKKHRGEIAEDRAFWEKVAQRKDEDKAAGIAALKAEIQAKCAGDPVGGFYWAAGLGFGDVARSYSDQIRSGAEKRAESHAYSVAESEYLAGWAEAESRRKSGAVEAKNAEEFGLKMGR